MLTFCWRVKLPYFLFCGSVVRLESVESVQMRVSDIQNVSLVHVDALVQRTVVHLGLEIAGVHLVEILKSRVRHRLWVQV